MGKLDLKPNVEHEIFGRWEELISKVFIRQRYLIREKTDLMNDDKNVYLYKLGPRAFVETSKQNILSYVSKICKIEVDTLFASELNKEEESSESEKDDDDSQGAPEEEKN